MEKRTDGIRNGEQYKASLRDGRRVVSEGEIVEDVTEHPTFKRSVDNLATLFDDQNDPLYEDILTFTNDQGTRLSTGWMVPNTKEDLEKRRLALRHSTMHTAGVYGRPPDYGSTIAMGYLSILDQFERYDSASPDKIRNFIEKASFENAICADILAEPQQDKSIPTDSKPGRLRVVEETADGVYLYGGKAVGSVAPIGNYMTVANLVATDMDPNAQIWCQVPVNAPGLTIVCRPPVTHAADPMDSPIDAYGDEPDAFYIFDRVFVPWSDIFGYKSPQLMGLYYPACGLAHWHILARLWYRAELFAGLAQSIVDVLAGSKDSITRNAVAGVFAYAQSLKSFVLAAESQAKHTETGVLIPDIPTVTVGRLYSTENYPKIMQTLRELSSQGLVSRFSKSTWAMEDVNAKLDEFMVGHGVSTRAKNNLFNLAWDMTSSSHAMRVAMFEHLNATPPAVVREYIYRNYDPSEAQAWVTERAAMGRV